MRTGKTAKWVSMLLALAFVVSMFVGCGDPGHTHSYVNGVCTECDHVCTHDFNTSGICKICNLTCKHEYENGKCKVCKYVCKHKFENGACKYCTIVCDHDYNNNGVCKVCGSVCAHDYYADGVCTECGVPCAHEKTVHLECTVCGTKIAPHYDYSIHTVDSKGLPKIYINNVNEADKATNIVGGLMYTGHMNFPGTKDNRPYWDCKISVNNCDSDYVLEDVVAEVKIRGNYTSNYIKKPLRIKFDKKQKMLGLNDDAKAKSWVLIADWKDNSMTRNMTALYLAKQILGSDDYYSSDFRQVELYLNDQYWGVYFLAEQQQVNENRVNITEPEKNATNTDIGYMIEYDGYYTYEKELERFTLNYDKYGKLKEFGGSEVNCTQTGFAIKNDVYDVAQKNFIADYMDKLYGICYNAVYKSQYKTFDKDYNVVAYTPKTNNPVKETVSKIMDTRSLVDTYILNEICCDLDVGWSSFCMDVDLSPSGDKLLRFEAPWDWDSTLGLVTYPDNSGLYVARNKQGRPNPWLLLFINQDWFRRDVKDKWDEMTANNVKEKTFQVIEYGKTTYADAFTREFARWNGFRKDGELNYRATAANDHAGAVAYLKTWFTERMDYLASKWKNSSWS